LENSLVTEIISDHLKNLENKNYKAICKALKVKMKDVIAAVNVIRALEPKPGRQFNEETPHYIIPDIYVYKSEGNLSSSLTTTACPSSGSILFTSGPSPQKRGQRQCQRLHPGQDAIRGMADPQHPPAPKNHL
jgi:hypothetical protein